MITNIDGVNSPVRNIKGKAELYKGSAFITEYVDDIKRIEIERAGESSKFFGFGVYQRLNIKLIDIPRAKEIDTSNSFKILFDCGGGFISPFTSFEVTEVNRDEKTNELSITAYDALKRAEQYTVSQLGLTAYTIEEFVSAVATYLGLDGYSIDGVETSFSTYYEAGANFEGTETLKDALTAAAEATQTIYYIDNNTLIFKRLDRDGAAALTITSADYIELDTKANRRLTAITHTTELGDSVTAAGEQIGTTQTIKDNAFLELREDISTLLDNALAAVNGLTINQFSCFWRGNYGLQIGDKIELISRGGISYYSYMLNDTISFNGAYSQNTSWSYEAESDSSTTNSTTIGEALKETFARVDKANKEITLLASESKNSINNVNNEIETIKKQVELTITTEELEIAVKQEVANGVDKVVTTKGYAFTDEGLMVENLDAEGNRISETATQITENGMKVFDSEDNEVLTANNIGVNAANLHATTYLIVGNNSRFEDFERNGEARTGCFWIGV